MKQDWATIKLEDACEVDYGTRVVQKRDGGTTYPVYGGGGATFFMDETNRKDCLVVARFAMSEQCTRFVMGEFFLNDSGLTVRSKNTKEILQEFLDLQFFCLNDHIYSLARGTAQKNLNVTAFRNIEIHYPKSLPEQQRIVAILDKSFAAIAKAKANAEQNLKNAKELFESTKKDVFNSLEGVANKVSLPSTCDKIFAGGDVPKDNYSKTKTDKYQIPIIANAVKDNGLYGFTDKIRVSKPSLTIAARGSGTGHTEIRKESFFPIVRLIVLTPNIEMIYLDFLKYSIQNLEILRSGSAIPQLTVPMIKGYSIPLPKLEKQKQIVRKLDTISAKTKRLEAIYQQKTDDLEELKKSVLQKAFSGELK